MKLYRAVVENNKDPDELAKVQVRIKGIHSDSDIREFEGSETPELPWAEVMGGTDFGLSKGVGVTSVLRNETLVWVMLEEDDPNRPTIIGTVKGIEIPEEGDPIYDTSEASRGDLEQPTIKAKNDSLHEDSGEPAQEPSEYTKLATIVTDSGHMIELDDTPGNVRVQIIDAHGNYFQMAVEQYIEKAIADKLEIAIKNTYKFVNGAIEYNAEGNMVIKDDVLIEGKLQVLKDIKTEDTVYDEYSSLRMLRETYDSHYHIGNLGFPTSGPIITDPGDETDEVIITYA